MTRTSNPFTPGFGIMPYVVAGRDDILDDMRDAFAEGNGNPNLSTLLIGARGTGKTVLMSRIRSIAVEEGWLAVSTTALPGMLENLYQQSVMVARPLFDSGAHVKPSSVTARPRALGWEHTAKRDPNWRLRMSDLLDRLSAYGTRLLMTVDEVHESTNELHQLVAIYQYFVCEGRNVALVLAGLPDRIGQLTSHETVSFLSRCVQRRIGHISSSDVAEALRLTVVHMGKDLTQEATNVCVEAIDGFAYMLQLVGYRMWNAGIGEKVIGIDSAMRGISATYSDMEQNVLPVTYQELSTKDVAFLEAMLADEGVSRLRDIAQRMKVSSGYASAYRTRLLQQGLIREQGQGSVAFDLPGLKAYVAARAREELD